MNWGHKILVVYLLFVAGILFLAFQSSKQNVELVTTDYYGKELVYQQKIDEMKRASLLSDSVQISIVHHELTIAFPKDFLAKQITGKAVLYCPSDETKDLDQKFTVTDSLVHIPVPASYHGLHYVKLSWSANGLTYYYEHKIII